MQQPGVIGQGETTNRVRGGHANSCEAKVGRADCTKRQTTYAAQTAAGTLGQRRVLTCDTKLGKETCPSSTHGGHAERAELRQSAHNAAKTAAGTLGQTRVHTSDTKLGKETRRQNTPTPRPSCIQGGHAEPCGAEARRAEHTATHNQRTPTTAGHLRPDTLQETMTLLR